MHVNYPHHPGYLYDCPECEDGPCMCEGTTNAPCVSDNCVAPEDDEDIYGEFIFGPNQHLPLPGLPREGA